MPRRTRAQYVKIRHFLQKSPKKEVRAKITERRREVTLLDHRGEVRLIGDDKIRELRDFLTDVLKEPLA